MAKKKNNKSKNATSKVAEPVKEQEKESAGPIETTGDVHDVGSEDQVGVQEPTEEDLTDEVANALESAKIEEKAVDANKTTQPEETAQSVEKVESLHQSETAENAQDANIESANGAESIQESTDVKEVPEKEGTQPVSKKESIEDSPLEANKEEIQSSESTPEPKVPTVKKRLTLQERLALAAKSKKSKRTASGANGLDEKKSKAASPEPSTRETSVEPIDASKTTPLASETNSVISTREPSLDIRRPEPNTLFPSDFKELPVEELHKLVIAAENKFLGLESKNESLNIEKQSLHEKIRNLSTTSAAIPASSSVSAQVLKEKDDKIAQLLKEGENLSMRELKYTNTIKKLKASESDYDREIQRLSKRVDSLEAEKKSSKDETKRLKDSEQQLSVKSKTLQIQLDNEREALQEEINRNKELSKKIEELSQVLIQEKNQAFNTINELKRSLEKEKQKAKTSKEDSLAEINRLEGKIEQLRYQSENAQAHTTTDDESYLKLIRQHDTLQSQYTSATENWQSIEASLMSRISNYEIEVSNFKDKLESSEQKNEILSNDLRSGVEEIEKLKKELKALSLENSRSQTKLTTISKDYEELQGDLERKEMSFNKEKAALEYEIVNLKKQFKENVQPQHLTIPTSHSTGEFSPQIPQSTSTPSFKRGGSWEISLGESSTTPRQSRKSSALYFPTYNQRNGSFDENIENTSDFDDNDTVNSPVSQYNNGTRYDTTSSLNGGHSVQMLGKMSSQVRRLETELSTLKEEMEKLTEDKKAANEEIVRLMKDNENVQSYKSKIEELEIQVDNYSRRHEKTLEILGEKSEQVEELKADVQDLKDLCRQQVQQLVDLQMR